MAATYYVSVDDPSTLKDPKNAGTSSTAADLIELRMGDGTTIPSKRRVLLALKIFERWIMKDGLGAGANLPAS